MSSRFIDKFARDDGEIGSNYLVACGGVGIFDEAVLPINIGDVVSGLSPNPYDGHTDQKTQVLYSEEAMDSSDQVVRGVWAHDEVVPAGVTNAPCFTLLARMTKDPLLFDLGVDEQPYCYDQGYGLRVTCPLDGSAPVLKIIKYLPRRRAPNLSAPSSVEPDGAVVLTSVTLESDDLNVDPAWDETGDFPYRGYWQDMRLRIRRADNEVVLDAFLNDRHLNQTIISFTDRRDPLWGAIGLPGFEFLSAALTTQPSGASPFGLASEALMRCNLFQVETVKDFRQPVTVTPGNYWTYDRVTARVITLVEKSGDARYNATDSGQTKINTYLDFVVEAEKDIIRREGYFQWLLREQRIYLKDGVSDYEGPEDLGLIEYVRPGNFTGGTLREVESWLFHQQLTATANSAGRPSIYTLGPDSPNNRKTLRLYPCPLISPTTIANNDDPYIIVRYYAKMLRPNEPDVQIPFVPQDHIDVLVYGAAAHALLLDPDSENAQMFAQVYATKVKHLTRANNRPMADRQIAMRHLADVVRSSGVSRDPLLRIEQLTTLTI
jgi:hypothetical protein